MNRYAIIVFWSDADEAWIAEAPDLEPCAAHGDTPEKAVAELRVACRRPFDGHWPPAFRSRRAMLRSPEGSRGKVRRSQASFLHTARHLRTQSAHSRASCT